MKSMQIIKHPSTGILSERSAAHVIGISRLTLQRARKRGDISHYRIGRRVLYGQNHITEYLATVEHNRHAQGKGQL